MKKAFLFLSCCVVAVTFISSPSYGQGTTRVLVCRGKPGIVLKIQNDPSPDNPRNIRVAMQYERATQKVDEDFNNLAPGTCSWNPANWPDVPLESGVVYFDLPKEAQPWSETVRRLIDTTLNAAVHFPDMITLPRYLNDPSKYWLFYIDDKTNFSVSYTATKHHAGPPVFTEMRGVVETRPENATKPASRTKSPSSSVVGRTQSLEYVTVDRKLDQFNLRFRARKNASPQVRYSTSAPLREPSTGRLYFPGAGYTTGGGVEQIGGFQADVSILKPLPLVSGAEFVGRSRLKPQRGTVYHFIIRIPKDANGDEEQYTGQFTTMTQTVRVELETVKILKEPDGLNSFWSWVLFSADGPAEITGAGNMTLELQNASERVRMIVGAEAEEASIHQDYVNKHHWTLTPKAGMGIALIKHEFDTRSMTPGKRYPFNLSSARGMDIEFYITGYVEVSHQ